MARLPGPEDLGQRPTPQAAGGIASYRGEIPGAEAPGQAMVAMGKTIAGVGDELWHEQEKLNTIKAEEAFNELRRRQLDLSIGQGGFATLKGGDAVQPTYFPKYMGQFNTAANEIGKNLENDRQKELFKRRAEIAGTEFKGNLLNHAVQQADILAKMTTQAVVDTEIANIAANPMDEGKVAFSNLRISEALASENKRLGIANDSPIALDQAQKIQDAATVKRVDAALFASPFDAEKLFNVVEKQITSPEIRDALRAKIQRVKIPLMAGNDADAILAEVRQMPKQASVKFTPGTKQRELESIDVGLSRDPGNEELLQAKYVIESSGDEQTPGIPNAKAVAAQLPLALIKATKRVNQLYGTDSANPERATYAKLLDAEIRQKNSHDVQALNAIQAQALDELGTMIRNPTQTPAAGMLQTGGKQERGGFQSISQVMQDPRAARLYSLLDHRGQNAVANEIRIMANEEGKGDPTLMNDMRNRLYLPSGDPNKINTWSQIMTDERVQRAALTPTQLNYLRADFERSQTEDGRSYTSLKKMGELFVRGQLMATVPSWDKDMGGAESSKANLAQLLWAQNVDTVVAQYNKEGKDIRPLFDPTSKESLVNNQEIQRWRAAAGSFTPAQALAAAAEKAKGAEQPIVQPKNIDTREKLDAWFQTLPPTATTFVSPDGKVFAIPARAGVTPAGAPATGAQNPLVTAPGEQAAPPVPAAAAAAPEAAVALTADAFELVDKPTTVSGNIEAIRKARTRAMEIRQGGAQGPQFELYGPSLALLKSAIQLHGTIRAAISSLPKAIGEALAQIIPTELDAVHNGFQAIKKNRKISAADEDILTEVIKYGLLPAEDDKLARALLTRLRGKK